MRERRRDADGLDGVLSLDLLQNVGKLRDRREDGHQPLRVVEPLRCDIDAPVESICAWSCRDWRLIPDSTAGALLNVRRRIPTSHTVFTGGYLGLNILANVAA